MTVVIDSIERALEYITKIDAELAFDEDIEFSDELADIRIKITGEKYHGTVPGELARGLWEYQEALYKAAAFGLTGIEDIRKLSTLQRQELELVFQVIDGSTDLVAPITAFTKALGEGFKSMDSRNKAIVLVCIAVLLAAGFVGWKALESSATTKQEEIKAGVQIRLEEEKTKQFAAFSRITGANATIQKFDKAVEEGTRSILRAASDAQEVKVGRVTFNRSDIQEVNQRATRTASTASIVEGMFRVFGTESKLNDSTRYTLSGEDGIDFPVIINHSELSPDDLDKIWNAAKSRTSIGLEVSITKNKGLIKTAQVVSVL